MKRTSTFLALILSLFLAGCAIFAPPPEPGTPENAIVERYGKPIAVYEDGDSVVWEYGSGYWSQQKYMAKIGKDKRLISWDQVWTNERFARLKIGKSTHADVLKTVGRPYEVSRIRLHNYEVWSYRYKQDDVWDSVMNLMFDGKGVLQKMESGMDLDYTDGRRFPGSGGGFGIGVGGGRWGGNSGGGGGIGINF